MNIVFLDIDGVLVTNRSCRLGRSVAQGPFDPEAVSNLNALLTQTGAKVVISSAWRTDPSLRLGQLLEKAGAMCEIVGQTPVLGPRGFEIAVWLARHPQMVDEFVILDDIRDSILCGHLAERLVSTTMDTGFDAPALARALAILKGEEVSPADPGFLKGFDTFAWGRP